MDFHKVLRWLLLYLFCPSIVKNAVIVTTGTFKPYWKWDVWRRKIWFNPPFLWKCLYQVRAIAVFSVFRLLTDFVCLYTYEICLSLWKIARCSVILLFPLFPSLDSRIYFPAFNTNPLTTVDELKWSKSVSSSCSTSCIRRVSLPTNPAINNEWRQDRIVNTTNGMFPWSFVTQIFPSV
jgi:hypothetical protein